MSHGMMSGGELAEESSIALPGVMRTANGEQPYGLHQLPVQYGAVEGQVISAHPPPVSPYSLSFPAWAWDGLPLHGYPIRMLFAHWNGA